MRQLNVTVEQNGAQVPVGVITGNDTDNAQFQYLSEYCNDPNAIPLSINLPLREEPFSTQQTATYFEGLLPEGFTRRSVAQWLRVDESDYLSILHGLGRECLGAVCITEPGEKTTAKYEPITKEQISELASEGATKSAELVTKSHLSLTGASGKVGLYYDTDNDKWYFPHGTAPSTHIVKQSHVRLSDIVTNEQLCMMTAKLCGIEIPDSFIINTGDGKEHEVLFATKRFDRVLPKKPKIINGLKKPQRLHQEDFAQAMGIPSSRKYEQGNEEYMTEMFEILRKYSSYPIQSQLKLWDMIVFSVLIGNTDAHIKNFSLLYGPNLKTINLAPAYDIVSTTLYEQSTRELAFSIGGVRLIDDVDEAAFKTAAKQAGLGERIAMQHFEQMNELFPKALEQSAQTLTDMGYPKAKELKARILQR